MNRKTKSWIEVESIPREPYVKPKGVIVHLYIRGENRVVCTPRRPIGDKVATIYTSKVTCRNCINKAIREKKQMKHN